MISLTDDEMTAIADAARPVPPKMRSEFPASRRQRDRTTAPARSGRDLSGVS
jgi:hypothetical protein